MKSTKYITFILATALALASCDVFDPIHQTPHPNGGRVTITTNWNDRDPSIPIPGSHHVRVNGQRVTFTQSINEHPHLFDEGTHRLHIYHYTDGITVNGNIASKTGTSTASTGTRNVVTAEPDFLFTAATDLPIERDRHIALTVNMEQQVRQLTLTLTPQGSWADNVAAIEASLAGVAQAWNFDTNQPTGNPATVNPRFEKQENGNWVAVVRLLGITGNEQYLNVNLSFDNGAPDIEVEISGLTTLLADFNADKQTPLALAAFLVFTTTEAGFTATINDWQQEERNITAE